MLFLTLLSLPQRPLRVLRRLEREIKERARRTIGRALLTDLPRTFFFFFSLRGEESKVLLLKQTNLRNIQLTSNNSVNYFLIQLLVPECILGPWESCCRKLQQVLRLFCAVPAEQ